MLKRLFGCLTILVVGLVPTRADGPADGKKAPAVVVRIRSIDTIVENIKLGLVLAGKENLGTQIEGYIKTKTGPNGLEGIDHKKPLGFYGFLDINFFNSPGYLMIPIAEEKAFLRLLDGLGFQVNKDKTGLYSFKPNIPVEVFFRFANGYAYVSILNRENLDQGNLISPDKIFPANQTASFSATLRLDHFPKTAQLIAINNLEQKLVEAEEKGQPGETEKQKEFRIQILKEVAKNFKAVLEDGADLNVALDINPRTRELAADVRFTARPGSDLARVIKNLGQSKSLFADLRGNTTAVRGLAHLTAGKNIRKALIEVIDEGTTKGLAAIADPARRKQGETLLKALTPTLSSAEIDAAFNFAGPTENKHYNLVAGFKLKDGNNLARVIQDLVADLLKEVPPEEKAKIKLNAESVGDIKIHRIDGQGRYDEKTRAIFGDNPIYLAFRDDAFFLGAGEDVLPVLKKALTAPAGPAAPLQLEINLARILPLLANTDEDRELAQKLFENREGGKIRLMVEGGDSVRLNFTSRLEVVQVLSRMLVRSRMP